MGALPCSGPAPIDQDIMNEIDKATKKSVAAIPRNYAKEQERIVAEMKRSSPRPYENLLYSEYPEKNQAKVNELALKNVASEASKKEISDEINKQIEPKVEEKTADQPELARMAIRRAVEKAIEKAVDKAVDASIEAIKKDNTETRS